MTDQNKNQPSVDPLSSPWADTQPPERAGQSSGWERSVLEKLAFSALTEQRRGRRWKLFLRLAWLAYFVVIAVLLFSRMDDIDSKASISGEHVALVRVRGVIAEGEESSAANINTALRNAFENDNAAAVILLFNSPGGSPVQAGMINDEIHRLRDTFDKPVYAVVEDACASAAYYIAVAADDIYVDKASIVGSIGVLMNGFGFTGTMEKLGVERRLITAGDNKGFLDPFSPMAPQQREFAENMVDKIHQQFIKVVRDGRGERLKETPDMFSGLFWTGEDAVTMGLADGMGSASYVAREIVGQENIVDYSVRKSFADRLANTLGSSAGEAAMKAVQTRGWLPEVQ